MHRKWPLAGGLALLVLAAAVAWGWYLRGRPKPVPARSEVVVPAPQAPEISLQGKIQARNIVNIAAPMDGIVDQYLVNVGEEVFEGEVLARIKNPEVDSAEQAARTDAERAQAHVTDLEAQLIAARLEVSRAHSDAVRAKAEYDRTQKAYTRQQQLLDAGATPRLTFEKAEQDYQNAKAEYGGLSDAAQAAEDRVTSLSKEIENAKAMVQSKSKDLDNAEAQLAGGELRSQVNGVVVARRGQQGDHVDQSMKDLLQIAVDLSDLQVVVDADARAAEQIRPGQTAMIRIAEAPAPIEGAVREITPTKASGGGQVFVDFTSPSAVIKPGLTAQVLFGNNTNAIPKK
jgi:HlyD family secretion protein